MTGVRFQGGISGVDVDYQALTARLEEFLTVGQPWSGDPEARVGFSVVPEPPADDSGGRIA